MLGFPISAGQQAAPDFLGSAAAITAQDARKRATELHARMRLGEDPAGQKIESRARAAETLGSVLQPYLLHKKAGRTEATEL